MRAIEPMQHWLVSADIEAVQLTNSDPEEGANSTANKLTQRSKPTNNLIVIQVIDKLLFVLFLIIVIVLHN